MVNLRSNIGENFGIRNFDLGFAFQILEFKDYIVAALSSDQNKKI
jgi:hypothetical protein